MGDVTPRFPLYVVSYDRYTNCRTATELLRYDIPFYIVVEPHQYDKYARNYDEDRLLAVPEKYRDEYDTFDNGVEGKSRGPGPARNFAWEHSIEQGYDRHWVMDDNIQRFYRYHENEIIPLGDAAGFRCMEDFVLQYENIAMAGPRYESFIIRRAQKPPLTFNTRVYSCNLIRNAVDLRWRGRYNEDTDLSIRMLKDGECTVLFNTILQNKVATQEVEGGNTENFYRDEGTYPKSKMLKQMHPSITTLRKRWGRWHHEVNYRPFRGNELVKKDDPDVEVGDYDLDLVPA
jgi:hypothetical protein